MPENLLIPCTGGTGKRHYLGTGRRRHCPAYRINREFLDQDGHDPALYDLLFNNDRNSPERIAGTIAGYVEAGLYAQPHPVSYHGGGSP